MKIDLQVYRGYMNDEQLVIAGHAFRSPSPRQYMLDAQGIRFMHAVYKMFTIEPQANAKVTLQLGDLQSTTYTMEDGYFQFRIPIHKKYKPAWHVCSVVCEIEQKFNIVQNGEILKPHPTKYGIISDIDDTFLVSHSDSIWKKLSILLSKNVHEREIFDHVIDHYQLLSTTGTRHRETVNAFFYVSSSEWNLYPFIEEFSRIHQLPKAVIKLKKIKTGLLDFLATGRGSHSHKFEKIKDIISFYPYLKYILLGDDTQKDPFLYDRSCRTFPENIEAVYIRQTTRTPKAKVKKALQNIEKMGIKTFYYEDSLRAIEHTRDLDLEGGEVENKKRVSE